MYAPSKRKIPIQNVFQACIHGDKDLRLAQRSNSETKWGSQQVMKRIKSTPPLKTCLLRCWNTVSQRNLKKPLGQMNSTLRFLWRTVILLTRAEKINFSNIEQLFFSSWWKPKFSQHRLKSHPVKCGGATEKSSRKPFIVSGLQTKVFKTSNDQRHLFQM